MGSDTNGGIDLLDKIISVIVLVAVICLAKYIWHGLIWAFNEYIQLLRIK